MEMYESIFIVNFFSSLDSFTMITKRGLSEFISLIWKKFRGFYLKKLELKTSQKSF